MRRIALALTMTLLPLVATAGIDDLVTSALAADSRPEADKARDANRKPLETLTFFGLTADMRVLEMFPGGGWYTRVLAPVLADSGTLYITPASDRLKDGLLAEEGFSRVKVLETGANVRATEQRGVYVLDPFDLGVSELDLVLTFRNLHNFESATRRLINDATFKALKSGGHYGIVDHTRRHMEASVPANRRRLDPVLAIKELEEAGFEFVDFSDLHYRQGDPLDLEVGEESVTGRTDRFTLLFRKP